MEKNRKILAALMQMEGTAALKLSLFEKLKADGMLVYEEAEQVKVTEDKLRSLVAAEKENG